MGVFHLWGFNENLVFIGFCWFRYGVGVCAESYLGRLPKTIGGKMNGVVVVRVWGSPSWSIVVYWGLFFGIHLGRCRAGFLF